MENKEQLGHTTEVSTENDTRKGSARKSPRPS